MQEQQRGLLVGLTPALSTCGEGAASRAIVVLAYAVGKDVTFALMGRDEFLNGMIVFYNCLKVILFAHYK